MDAIISWATYMGQKLGPDAPLILGGPLDGRDDGP